MTLTIDRMEIDDVGGNPSKLANAIIKQLLDLEGPIPVHEIAKAIDITEIREEDLDGLEGALIVPEDKAFGKILINRRSIAEKKRFTIAHEIGHYVNPWHKSSNPEGFRCSSKDMRIDSYRTNDKVAKMEAEANQFAAELLMPTSLVSAFLRLKGSADASNIVAMKKRFDVSQEAAAIRYLNFIEEPAALVFSKDGVIRYIKKTTEFPAISVRSGQSVPSGSLTKRSLNATLGPTDWEEANGYIWLERSNNRVLQEQTLVQQNGFRITILLCEQDSDEFEDDVVEEPRFWR